MTILPPNPNSMLAIGNADLMLIRELTGEIHVMQDGVETKFNVAGLIKKLCEEIYRLEELTDRPGFHWVDPKWRIKLAQQAEELDRLKAELATLKGAKKK